MGSQTAFDLVTVNWNHQQTKLWLHHVRKHCPTANIVLIPDTKPFPWCWSSGKLNCFADLPDLRHPGRFMYMDTDTIVTRNLEECFELMEGSAQVGASSAIPATGSMARWTTSEGKKGIDVDFEIDPDHPVAHYSSGFMVLKDLCPQELGFKWRAAMEYPLLRAYFGRHRCYEEIALSYVLAADRVPVWDMPLEIHGNILRRAYFGRTKTPMVIHYHNPRRLQAQHLEQYLETETTQGLVGENT